MPTLHLVATSLEVTNDLPAKPSSIVGSPPQLSDGSDATYAEVWAGSSSGSTVRAHFDAVTWPEGVEVTSVVAHVRYSTRVEGGASTRRWGFVFRDQEFISVVFLGSPDLDGTAVGDATDEVTVVPYWPDWGATGASVRDALARPFDVWLSRLTETTPPAPYLYGLRVYELSLDVVYTAPARRTKAPPAQLSGRADGLGPLGGPPRLDTAAPSRQSGFHPGGYY